MHALEVGYLTNVQQDPSGTHGLGWVGLVFRSDGRNQFGFRLILNSDSAYLDKGAVSVHDDVIMDGINV